MTFELRSVYTDRTLVYIINCWRCMRSCCQLREFNHAISLCGCRYKEFDSIIMLPWKRSDLQSDLVNIWTCNAIFRPDRFYICCGAIGTWMQNSKKPELFAFTYYFGRHFVQVSSSMTAKSDIFVFFACGGKKKFMADITFSRSLF